MGNVPLRASAVEEALRGQPPSAEVDCRVPRRTPRGHRSAGGPEREAPTTNAILARVLTAGLWSKPPGGMIVV